VITLDIETRSLDPEHPEYALQPWRVREGLAEISCVGIHDGDEKKPYLVDKFGLTMQEGGFGQANKPIPKSSIVCCWNTIFDCSFLYATDWPIQDYKWIDAKLLCKWVENTNDDSVSYSLVNCAKRWLPGWDMLDVFVKLKENEQPQTQDKYWQARCKLDVEATRLIALSALIKLTPQQKKSAMIEAANIAPNSMAWVNGLNTNPKYYDEPIPQISREMAEIECRLGVSNAYYKNTEACYGGKGWTPSKILRSPKQLGDLLYEKWKLPCTVYTNTDAPSTAKAALTYLADEEENVLEILAWRSLNTRLTKFCQSPGKARKYLSSSVLHPEPKIFSTYTGRYTYGSKCDKKWPIAMALHQMPRGKEVRRMVEAPEDKILVEFDASGQEARLLAELGNVETMLRLFQEGKKFHAVTGAAIAGLNYDNFMKLYKEGSDAVAGPEGFYYCGKYVNLSNQYRVGAKKSRIIARVQYGLKKDILTIKTWQQAYHRTHPGVKQYWDWAIKQAKLNGYAETLAGRRCAITEWGGDMTWKSESTAINFPIQGSGGDMKNLGIATLAREYPDVVFAYDLHDGLFYWLPREASSKELMLDMRETLNNLDYKDAWSWSPRIPLPWDVAVGVHWGEMREL